jgi:hypothetical protein
VIANWPTISGNVAAALANPANAAATAQLLRVTRVPYDPKDPTTIAESVLGILWYNVFATNDAIARLGGQPFDNRFRFYRGSSNDWALNRGVARYRADWRALIEIQAHYQTSGRLAAPLVTMHTWADPIVPYWHEPLYRLKTWMSGSCRMHTNLPIFRYGHCRFDKEEALIALSILAYKVNAQP